MIHINGGAELERLKLESIRRESIESTFNVIAKRGDLTRAELAKATGLSLMTIGKSVELLERNLALMSYKKPTESPGRKSAVCSLNKNCVMLIYDLSAAPNRLYIRDLTLGGVAEYDFDPENPIETEMTAFVEYLSERNVIGTACVVPDNNGDIASGFTDKLGRLPELVVSRTAARAIAHDSSNEAETGVYIFIENESKTDGAIVRNGRIIDGDHGDAVRVDHLTELLGSLDVSIAAISMVIDPGLIHIEFGAGEQQNADRLRDNLTRLIDKSKCEIVVCAIPSGSETAEGAARLLRDQWVRGLK